MTGPWQAMAAGWQDLRRRVTYGLAPAASSLLGYPLVADPLVPEGQALVLTTGGRPTVFVGIPSRAATEGALIVRDGLADVLAWLGQPARPLALQLAASHYGLDRPADVEDEVEFDADDPATYACARRQDCGCTGTGRTTCPGWDVR